MYSNTSGDRNTAAGYQSLYSNTTGYWNTASGYHALYSNTSGYTNVATGFEALRANTTGYANAAMGYRALYANAGGNYNTAIGFTALEDNTGGTSNTASGYLALGSNTTGSYNAAYGDQSLVGNTTGSYNTAVGHYALLNTTGSDVTAIGANAGDGTGSSNSVFVGSLTDPTAAGYSNCAAIGYGTTVSGSNRMHFGNTSVSWIGGQVSWSTYSDARMKVNVTENVPGLDFIRALRPVTYNLSEDYVRAGTMPRDDARMEGDVASLEQAVEDQVAVTYSGFIAQEVRDSAQAIGYNFSGVDVPDNDTQFYSLRYAEFVVPLVKAVQELARENEELRKRVEELERR
jgi:hypothetical protein